MVGDAVTVEVLVLLLGVGNAVVVVVGIQPVDDPVVVVVSVQVVGDAVPVEVPVPGVGVIGAIVPSGVANFEEARIDPMASCVLLCVPYFSAQILRAYLLSKVGVAVQGDVILGNWKG